MAANPPEVCTVHGALLSIFVSSMLLVMRTECFGWPSSPSTVVMVTGVRAGRSSARDFLRQNGEELGEPLAGRLTVWVVEAGELCSVERAGVVVVRVLGGWCFPGGVVEIDRISLHCSFTDSRARADSPTAVSGVRSGTAGKSWEQEHRNEGERDGVRTLPGPRPRSTPPTARPDPTPEAPG